MVRKGKPSGKQMVSKMGGQSVRYEPLDHAIHFVLEGQSLEMQVGQEREMI